MSLFAIVSASCASIASSSSVPHLAHELGEQLRAFLNAVGLAACPHPLVQLPAEVLDRLG
jgi:hypothetical protein